MPQKIDYTGFENEYIKVIGESNADTQQLKNSTREHKTVYYDCLCKKCNSVFASPKENLKKIKSCGCTRTKAYDKCNNEIGKQYNSLTVLEIDMERSKKEQEKRNNQFIFVKCKCECGNIKSYNLAAIKSGHTKSCGCIKFNNPKITEDLSGNEYGRLTAIKRDLDRDKKEKGVVHWLCKCSCGNPELVSISAYQLKSGGTRSCGCLVHEMLIERNKTLSSKSNRPVTYKDNIIGINDDIIEIFDEEKEHSFLIDKQDYDSISMYYWRKITEKEEPNPRKRYWVTNNKQKNIDNGECFTLRLHQIIAKNKYGEYDKKIYVPDHLSRNPDDNTRKNIVLKSNINNSHNRGLSRANSSGKTGVYWNKPHNCWSASIMVNYENHYLGDYDNYNDAVDARLKAEEKYGFTCDEIFPEYDVKEVTNVSICTA